MNNFEKVYEFAADRYGLVTAEDAEKLGIHRKQLLAWEAMGRLERCGRGVYRLNHHVPTPYDHFAEGVSPEPPFLIFLFPGSDNMFADNGVYFKISQLNMELYTDKKDPELEEKLEDILTAHEIPWEKSEVWIDSEKMYEVLYQTEI